MRKKLLRALLVGACLVPMALGTGTKAAPVPTLPDSPVGAPLVGNGSFCSGHAAITGHGSTFQNAALGVFSADFAHFCPSESMTYGGGGSGTGDTEFINRGSSDYYFGSDDPLSLDQTACATLDQGIDGNQPGGGKTFTCAPPKTTLHVSPVNVIPIAVGAVSIVANMANCSSAAGIDKINYRSQVLALIFSGAITRWNDPLLVQDNPSLANCNQVILPVVRADYSGTTFAYKDFLSKRNSYFAPFKQPQLNTTWPPTLTNFATANGGGALAAKVASTPNAIGYVNLADAKSKGATWGKVDGPTPGLDNNNNPVLFRTPDNGHQAACVEAAAAATTPVSTTSPGWDAVSITDSPAPNAYPICTFTYAYTYTLLRSGFGAGYSSAKGRTLVDYLLQALTAGTQTKLSSAYYTPLPEHVRAIAELGVATMTDAA